MQPSASYSSELIVLPQNAWLTWSGFGMQAIPKKAVLLVLPVNAFIVQHKFELPSLPICQARSLKLFS
jgi:hypothetical protein